MSDRFEPTEAEGGERIINPGRDGFTIKARLPEPLTEEEMSKIKLGTSAIYFYGAISYRDAFSRQPQDAVPLSAWRRAPVRHRGSRAVAARQQGDVDAARRVVKREEAPPGGAGLLPEQSTWRET